MPEKKYLDTSTGVQMILVVDDTPDIIYWLKEVIEEAGYYFDFALEPHAGLFKMSSIRYSLAFIDIILPGMDGIELAKRVRGLPPPFSQVPLVGMTGAGEVTDPEHLFVHVMRKPFLPRHLREAIQLYAFPPVHTQPQEGA